MVLWVPLKVGSAEARRYDYEARFFAPIRPTMEAFRKRGVTTGLPDNFPIQQ